MAMLNLDCGQYLGLIKGKYHAEGVVISEIEYHQKVFEGWHFHRNKHLTLIISGGNREQRKHTEVEAFPGAVMIYNLNTRHPSKNINIEIDDCFFASHSLDPALFETLSPENPLLRLSALKAYRECLADDVNSILAILPTERVQKPLNG